MSEVSDALNPRFLRHAIVEGRGRIAGKMSMFIMVKRQHPKHVLGAVLWPARCVRLLSSGRTPREPAVLTHVYSTRSDFRGRPYPFV